MVFEFISFLNKSNKYRLIDKKCINCIEKKSFIIFITIYRKNNIICIHINTYREYRKKREKEIKRDKKRKFN